MKQARLPEILGHSRRRQAMSYRILVAEDDKGLNQGIRLALQKEDFTFDTAYTLKEEIGRASCRERV